MHIALSIMLAQLQSIVIDQLDLLWFEWLYNHSLSLYNLEIHKSPRMILYNPRQPSLHADELVLQDFFLCATAKDPTPKFYVNAHVNILLVMTNVQFEEVLLWQE